MMMLQNKYTFRKVIAKQKAFGKMTYTSILQKKYGNVKKNDRKEGKLHEEGAIAVV